MPFVNVSYLTNNLFEMSAPSKSLADLPIAILIAAAIDLSEMKDEKFIFMNANSGLRRESLEVCLNAGFEPNVVLQSRQVETVLGFVAAGLGSTIIASRVAKFLKKSAYALVNFNNAPKRVTALAIPKNNHYSPTVKLFRSFMLERYKVG